MSDESLTTEGDYSKVPVQIAPGGTGAVERPTNGTHLIWGGSDPSSPWAHLQALISNSGGSVSYLQTDPATLAANSCEPTDAPGEAPVSGSDSTAKQDDSEEPEVTQVAPVPHPAAPGLNHVSGSAGTGALFEGGIDIAYQGEPARLWAHPRAANSGPRPLIIYLHGINPSGHLHPALSSDVGKSGIGWMHMGMLAARLVRDGKVTPLAMAAPTHSSNAPWDKIDFEELVNLVETKFKESGVEIDLDQITVVGHSGAGGYPGRGLNKLADQQGMIGAHKLKLFGIADTRITADMGTAYKNALAKNDTTAIYAVHRYTGGWSTNEYNASGGSPAFAKALGATNQNKTKVVGDESFDNIVEYWDNDGAAPARVSLKVKQSMGEFTAFWRAAGGYGTPDLGSHQNVLPRWTWWALPRFYAQTEADQKLLASATEEPVAPKPVAPPPPPPTQISGGTFNIPPAAKPWTNPAGDIPPKMLDGFEFAPATGLYYPVRAAKLPAGRGVYYIGEDNKQYGPKGLGDGHAGFFLANRGTDRKHVGLDMSIDAFEAMVVAAENGKIVNFYHFYENAWCLILQGASGTYNYGEVDANSLKDYKLKVGQDVIAGQPIGNIRKMQISAMLHFETYRPGTQQNRNYYPDSTNPTEVAKSKLARAELLNPSQYVLALAKNGQ